MKITKKKNRIGTRFWFLISCVPIGTGLVNIVGMMVVMFMENNNNAKVIGIGPVRIYKTQLYIVITFTLAHV